MSINVLEFHKNDPLVLKFLSYLFPEDVLKSIFIAREAGPSLSVNFKKGNLILTQEPHFHDDHCLSASHICFYAALFQYRGSGALEILEHHLEVGIWHGSAWQWIDVESNFRLVADATELPVGYDFACASEVLAHFEPMVHNPKILNQ